MTESETARFAAEWIAAWNNHDLERVLVHYADEVELTSPLAGRILGRGETTVRGKTALRAYFRRALDAYPDLEFTLWGAYSGTDSLVVHYQSVAGLRAAEYMRIDADGKVCQVIAHYAPPD
jgi:hypothetical protein